MKRSEYERIRVWYSIILVYWRTKNFPVSRYVQVCTVTKHVCVVGGVVQWQQEYSSTIYRKTMLCRVVRPRGRTIGNHRGRTSGNVALP